MEFFSNVKYVRLRSHHNKYLTASSDGESVRQSRNSNTAQARWAVELVQDKPNMIRLRSCYDKFLTASDETLMLGWTGKKTVQTVQNDSNASVHWEPIGEAGFYVKLRSPVKKKYLRGNFGAPPWSNSVTIDVPERNATRDWIMWVVDVLDDTFGNDVDHCVWTNNRKSLPRNGGTQRIGNESFCSISNDVTRCSTSSSFMIEGAEEETIDSTWNANGSLSVRSVEPCTTSLATGRQASGSNHLAMELFNNAKMVRLRSHHAKYLMADDDKEAVIQDRNGGSRRARWTIEHVKSVEGVCLLCLKSCYDKYLTATDDDFLLGVRGKKVRQTMPWRLDSSIEWEPLRDGARVKLKTRYGNFLRANGGVPPWHNSITHDIPSRNHTQAWILWKVDVLEVYPKVVEEVKQAEKENSVYERSESDVEPLSFQPPTRSESDESGPSNAKNEGH